MGLLGYSLEFLVLVPMAPLFWAALAILGIVAYQANANVDNHPEAAREYPRPRWLLELSMLLLMPISLLVAGEIFSHTNQMVEPGRDRLIMIVLMALATSQALISVWLIWRHRARLFATVIISILMTAWTVSVHFVTTMAATDNWL